MAKEFLGPDVGNSSEKEVSSDVSYAEAIRDYIDDADKTKVLRPKQDEVFDDFAEFFAKNLTRGFVDLPTGVGKTVIMVELSKALLKAKIEGRRPRILLITSFKDLVHQTLGKSGEKGYGKFAPDLNVGSYFSDTPDKQKRSAALDSKDVVVTTYHSLKLLSRKFDLTHSEEQEKAINEAVNTPEFRELEAKHGYKHALFIVENYYADRRALLDKFDVIILDEAHHAFAEVTENIINSLSPEKIVIGFTATPEADEVRTLSRILKNEIHKLTLKEAIWLGLLSPIVPIGVKTNIHVEGNSLFDETGEYLDEKLKPLSKNEVRNKIIVDSVKVMAESGVGTIVSCIAGGEAWHARHIADELNKQGVKAAAVYAGIPAKARKEIYEQFEKGEIDVLTFVGVLGEGWDSSRAKGLVNARPTRSPIFSKQRLGRITRPGSLAFAIDIIDIYDEKNPPITVADVINDGDVPFGRVIGENEHTDLHQLVLNKFKEKMAIIDTMKDEFSRFEEMLKGLDVLVEGKVYDLGSRTGKEYAVSSRISTAYSGVTDEIFSRIEELKNIYIKKRTARKGKSMYTVYDQVEASSQLYKLPELLDPSKYWWDSEDKKYISPESLLPLLSKPFPDLTEEIFTEILRSLSTTLAWVPTRYKYIDTKFSKHRIVKMYPATQDTINVLKDALTKYFAEQSE